MSRFDNLGEALRLLRHCAGCTHESRGRILDGLDLRLTSLDKALDVLNELPTGRLLALLRPPRSRCFLSAADAQA